MTPIKDFVISFAVRNNIKFDLSAYKISENFFRDILIKRNSLAFNWCKGNKKIDSIATDAFINKLTKENKGE